MDQIPQLPVYGFTNDLGGLLGIVLNVLLPIAVRYLTKAHWNGGLKGVVLLALAAVKTVVEAALQSSNAGVHVAFVPLVTTTLINFGIAVVVYLGIYRPAGITNSPNVPAMPMADPAGNTDAV